MADGKVEKIIEFQAQKAVNQLDQVIGRLNRVNQTLDKMEKKAQSISFEKFIPAINSFADSFTKLKIDTQVISDIQLLAQALNRFKMTSVELNKKDFEVSFVKITKGIYKFTDSISRMNLLNETISKIAALGLAINRLVNSSMKLQNIKVSFTSLTQAIYAFVGSILRIKDLDIVIDKLERLGNAMEKVTINSKKFNIIRDLAQFEKAKKKISDLQEKIKKLTDELKKMEKSSDKALTPFEKIKSQIVPAMQNLSSKLNSARNELATIRRLLTLSWLRSIFNMFKRIGEAIYDLTKKYAEYIENINLATVAYGGLEEASQSLYPFVEKISYAFGLNESEVIRTVGLFKQMANAMKLTQEQGDLLATTLTKMAYDISSLYNISFDRALSALQSALVGKKLPLVIEILLENLFNCWEILKEWLIFRTTSRKVLIFRFN